VDAATVIAILSAHLVCSGGLLRLLGARLSHVHGLRTWANGLMLYGGSIGFGLAVGLGGASPWAPVANLLTLSSLLVLGHGLRRFMVPEQGQRTLPLWIAALAYATAQAVAHLRWGAAARIVVHNAAMGAAFLWLGGMALALGRRQPVGDPFRTALGALAGTGLCVGLFSLVRAGSVYAGGLQVAYHGWMAQAYFGVGSVVGLLVALILLWLVFLRLNEQLSTLATRDALTRVLNRNGLDEALTRHFATRPAMPLTLLVVDIDHFKSINDRHGHGFGDAVLREVAAALARHLRGNDFVARLGGEEFLVGCALAEPAAARDLGERLRAGIEALEWPVGGGAPPLRCTASVGISAPIAQRADYEAALRAADRALYAAKDGGRNRVEVAPA
jgi:diguanylate cyclase (GGDEF)-like protein